MSTVHIHRFNATLRVAGAPAARHAAAVQRQLFDGELEAALAPHAPDEEIVLVRRLDAPAPMAARHTERQSARDWSDAIALQLDRVLSNAGTGNVLRFRHRLAAELAFAHDAFEHRSTRDWGWRRLGLLPERGSIAGAERLAALVRLFADESNPRMPLLRALSAEPGWPGCVAQLDLASLRQLAQAALRTCGGATPFSPIDDMDVAAPSIGMNNTPDPTPAAPTAPASPLDARTAAILDALLRFEANPVRRRWSARLTLLACEPRHARQDPARIDRLLDPWLAATEAQPGADSDGPQPPATAANNPGRDERPTVDVPASGPQADHRPRGGEPPHPDGEPLPPEDPAPSIGLTDHAGLQLLLPLLEPSGALAMLEDESVWPAAHWPFGLHRLATTLLPLAADDAAALAFCGRRPRDPVPFPHQRLDAMQHVALGQARDLLHDALARRLPEWRGPGLIERVARRRGRIVADPGWFEVRYALRDVSIDIRRAALDLDPGFIAWLGIVLRVVYE